MGRIGASPQLQPVEEAAAQLGLGIEIKIDVGIRDGLGAGVDHRAHHPRGGDGQSTAAGNRHGGAQLGAPPAGGAGVARLRNGDRAAAAEDRIAQWRGVGAAPAAGVGAGAVGVKRSDRLGGVLRIAGIERAQIVGGPDPQRAGCAGAAALEGDRRPEAGRRGDVGAGVGVTGPQHGDGGAEVAGIGEIEDRLARAAGEVVSDPGAIDDHHGAAAIGLRCRDHQIVGAVIVDIGHQHGGAEVLPPASAGIGFDQEAADAALIKRRIQQRQVGPVGREVGSGQGVEPGGGGLGWIADRAAQLVALAVGASGERAGEIDPHAPGRIADGIAGAGLGDGQPTAVGAGVFVGEGAVDLGVAEAAGRRRIAGRVLAAELHAAVDILELQRRCLQYIGGGEGLVFGEAVGFQRGGQAGAQAQGHPGAAIGGGVADAAAIAELEVDAGVVGGLRIEVVAVAAAAGLARDQQIQRRLIREEGVGEVGIARAGLQRRQGACAHQHLFRAELACDDRAAAHGGEGDTDRLERPAGGVGHHSGGGGGVGVPAVLAPGAGGDREQQSALQRQGAGAGCAGCDRRLGIEGGGLAPAQAAIGIRQQHRCESALGGDVGINGVGQVVIGNCTGLLAGVGRLAGHHEAGFLEQRQGVGAGGQRPVSGHGGWLAGGEGLAVDGQQIDGAAGVVAQQLGGIVEVAGGIGIDHVGLGGHHLAVDIEVGGAHIARQLECRTCG